MIDKMNLKYRAELIGSEKIKKYVAEHNDGIGMWLFFIIYF